MIPYIDLAFEHLFEFICLFGFSDVKYDNIPICTNGKIALIDLDQRSIISGLTRGGGNKVGGLLNYLPLEKLEKFILLAKEKLNVDNFEKLNKYLNEIKERVKKK